MAAITAKALASQLGVSEATLSLVINNKPGISQKTRTYVTNKLIDLGYGEMLKQDVQEPGGKTISFILLKDKGELLETNSFFPLILNGIETTCRKYDYSLTLINIDVHKLEEQLDYIRKSECCGFVIFATEMHKDSLTAFRKLNLPFVVLDNYFNDENVHCVKVNNEQGTYLAIKHLYELGHRKIGYLNSAEAIDSFRERRTRALDSMQQFGLTDCERYVYEIGYPHENAESGMDQLLDTIPLEDLPTAFLADNDLVAIGAMQSIKKHGYKIPDDFSIIGYDDRPICTLVDPALTTIQLPREFFGAAAIEELIRILNNPCSPSVNIEINGLLIPRQSAGICRR